MYGKVEEALRGEIVRRGAICLALLDCEGVTPQFAQSTAEESERAGVAAILVGGSTAIDQIELESVVTSIKEAVTLPVILFPGNVTGVSPSADAILFTSLLNSDNPYFITEAQALGALSVRRHSLEAIPTGYIIIGEGGASGFIGRARGLPYEKPLLTAMYALAARYMGMRFVYLEAGSGARTHIPPEIVSKVRELYNGVLLVGGGIKQERVARDLVRAGADCIIIGSLLESGGFEAELRKIVQGIQEESTLRKVVQ